MRLSCLIPHATSLMRRSRQSTHASPSSRQCPHAKPARSRSWTCRMPNGGPGRIDDEQRCDWAAHARSSCAAPRPPRHRGRSSGARRSSRPPTCRDSRSGPMARRKSPSVTMPHSMPSDPTMPRQPKRFSVMRTSAASIGISGAASGIASPACISVAHPAQPRTQPAARVDLAEIGRGEAAPCQQGDRDRIAQGHLHRGGCGGRQAHRTGLGGFGRIRATSAARARVESGRAVIATSGSAKRAAMRDQIGQFRRFARVRQGQHRVAGNDHAQVAMRSLGRMHEQRGRAGGGQRRGDLAADMAGLAHAGHDDPPGGRRQPVDCLAEAIRPGWRRATADRRLPCSARPGRPADQA